MDHLKVIGKSIPKKESLDKVTGAAKYTGDRVEAGMLHARMMTSPYAHAAIVKIDTSQAWQIKGVRAILTGEACDMLTGEEIRDRPIIAKDKVRYFGETVAVVVADSEASALQAVYLIKVQYKILPVVNSPTEAMRFDAPLVHEKLGEYDKAPGVISRPGTNIASIIKIRKGDLERGWKDCETIIENSVAFPPSDHAAMETRSALAEIRPDGHIIIETSSQAPFAVKKYMGLYFHMDSGKIIVKTPFVGGGYGGKAAIQLELIAYIASKAVGGRKVKIVNTREEDMVTSPAHIGLEARVKLGSTREGKITAAEIIYQFDGGAYCDKSSDVSRAAAGDCTGPYAIDNLYCDCLTLYTNHPYASAYRGYGHSELTFAIERAMDALADKLKMDPMELRMKNIVAPGDTSPTRNVLNSSNLGHLQECMQRMRILIEWDDWTVRRVDAHKVRAKGISCCWKNSSMDPDASSGAIVSFNADGSLNLESGVVEIGTGTKTVLAQMLAERMRMDPEQIHVRFPIHTQITPEHWKTVASRGTFMAGRAVLKAADDAIRQLLDIAACVLRVDPEDLELGRGNIFVKADPSVQIAVKDICYGYKYPNGNSIGGQIIGEGHYIQRQMTYLNPETGEGNPGPEWNVAAQAVEIELDTREYTYKMIKAVSVIDAGKVLNPKTAEGQVIGAMSMGLSFANRETFHFDNEGIIYNPSLRNYHLIRYGEQPEYVVEFVENPCLEAPFGARALGEHGLIGMPAALASALSRAAGVPLNRLPLFPECVWKTVMEAQHDSV
ncbi:MULTISPECIES: xanthine dehydrogenase family protein molybdopterin-binding subunit [unclassified Paenibacillus]|uniref:xanthine dehydrogenase family protein molybdopterin-binding subunit n=1 Tax=unclassified Paenibacillus TaxID=185978 RepID=UPI001AEAE0E0|nr:MULTISPECIES: xanthine dehydrogenase family protein molybdopterin-binding subunit [unclassified Paenibacillus]MBP1157404.1 CO/xanthine dehydrogenase Mo-binding subunit [Paenibacillus sp. PvP091]MBP1171858.1 CO/xanthine dehydrogenase Mo-binding subunit [Paenibacillus sp. PvR098]MBP2438239.1 CO/xanthine dehydrogenase Mo-binding subunit [Paenibacillus sp. PvP052]